MSPDAGLSPLPDDTTLVDLLDGLIDRGVVVTGDVVLSVAQIDLVHLGLQLVLHGIDAPTHAGGYDVSRPSLEEGGGTGVPPVREGTLPSTSTETSERAPGASSGGVDLGPVVADELGRLVSGGGSGELDPDEVQRGLASLVLTLVEVLRELLERQALRRMDHGTVSDDEIERLGRTFLALTQRMDELKDAFGLTDADLNLALGALGSVR